MPHASERTWGLVFRRAAPRKNAPPCGASFDRLRTIGLEVCASKNFPFKQGPRIRLCRSAGAAALSGGRELHAVSERGGWFSAGQSQGKMRPLGGQRVTRSERTWGPLSQQTQRKRQADHAQQGGQRHQARDIGAVVAHAGCQHITARRCGQGRKSQQYGGLHG